MRAHICVRAAERTVLASRSTVLASRSTVLASCVTELASSVTVMYAFLKLQVEYTASKRRASVGRCTKA